MPFDIATGTYTEAPDPVLPPDDSGLPGVAPPTEIVPGQLSGPAYDARDTQGEYAAPLAAAEADIRAAQAAGVSAENDRRAHYAADVLPVGAAYGDPVALPPVPAYDPPPAGSDLYPYPGALPTPAGSGLDFYDGPLPA